MSREDDMQKCEGCKHITEDPNEFCYMFKNAPDRLPCCQHDKYAMERTINGALIAKFPWMITGIINSESVTDLTGVEDER